jgi:hypothetical protein
MVYAENETAKSKSGTSTAVRVNLRPLEMLSGIRFGVVNLHFLRAEEFQREGCAVMLMNDH